MSNPSSSDSAKLLDRVRQILRRKHYSVCIGQAYVHWGKR